jgi:hypothetical protein
MITIIAWEGGLLIQGGSVVCSPSIPFKTDVGSPLFSLRRPKATLIGEYALYR